MAPRASHVIVGLLGALVILQVFHPFLHVAQHHAATPVTLAMDQSLAGEMRGLQGEFRERYRAELEDVRQEMAALRGDAANTRGEVAQLQAALQRVSNDARRAEVGVEAMAASVRRLETVRTALAAVATPPPPLPPPPAAVSSGERAKKPHLVMLLADDLGWHGVGWRNDEVVTPTLDRLATKEGVRLGQHYAYRTCSPSRSALLSGRLSFHVNQANPNNRVPGGGVEAGFSLLPEILRDRGGYATHFLGKWHLGLGDASLLPTKRGFGSWLGFFAGAEDHWSQRRAEARHDLLDLWIDEDGSGGRPAKELAGTGFGQCWNQSLI